MNENPLFYFTYGLGEDQPFKGGWTVVEAPDIRLACKIFKVFHPCRTGDFLNCCSVYTEDAFLASKMSGPKGNFGAFCHEHITVHHTLN